MLESEQKISGEWLMGVSAMEKKVLGMRETMSVTLDQLRESVKLLAQYRAKMQTLKIRIKIEEKVK
jgi:surfactin synthase thioesterase subunit